MTFDFVNVFGCDAVQFTAHKTVTKILLPKADYLLYATLAGRLHQPQIKVVNVVHDAGNRLVILKVMLSAIAGIVGIARF